MSRWTLRPATLDDIPRIVSIYNQSTLQPRTVEEFLLQEQVRGRQEPSLRLVVQTESGVVIGQGLLFRNPWRPVGTYWFNGSVDAAHGQMGAGSALLAAFEAQAREWGQNALECEARDDRPDGVAFLERHNFVRTDHYFRSELNLAQFDPERFRPALGRATASGYRFLTLAHLDQETGMRQVYDLDTDCSRDEPGVGPDWQPLDFAAYHKEIFAGLGFDPAGIFLAEKEGALVGICGLHFPPDNEAAWTFFTGVRREHRGQGLAQALKLLATEYARRRGCTMIGTGNHERNGAMLAVNRKFGFRPLTGAYAYRKEI